MPSRAQHPAPSSEDIATFRGFNRMYTRFIGVLEEGLLHSDFSLAEARILYELATRKSSTAKEIVQCLGIDPAYLSRVLAKFDANLLHRKPSKQDARSTNLTLTTRGKTAFKKLNALSDKQAREVLDALSPEEQTQLIGAMTSIQQLLSEEKEQARTFTLRPHRAGDMGWVVYREGALYAQEYGFDATFEALVARIVADFITNFNPKRERCWIAESGGQNIGHIFLVQHPDERSTAKLRLLLVEPSARGMRLGAALVEECIRFARAAGYKKITLWTQSILTAAHHIYKKAGFHLVEEKTNLAFGQNLISQTWELDLK